MQILPFIAWLNMRENAGIKDSLFHLLLCCELVHLPIRFSFWYHNCNLSFHTHTSLKLTSIFWLLVTSNTKNMPIIESNIKLKRSDCGNGSLQRKKPIWKNSKDINVQMLFCLGKENNGQTNKQKTSNSTNVKPVCFAINETFK